KCTIANRYKMALTGISGIQLPITTDYSTHVFHQYTLRVKDNRRGEFALYLKNKGISTMVYYPMLLSDQQAYKHWGSHLEFTQARAATEEVLSLPIDESLTLIEQQYIINAIYDFFS
ncbi:MAG: DegT/DnrJ/EryC1/StrS family aminotransferase, partial [Schleiferiaceae bacterium]|nr:DegT/DnrJ/EryC1/StrS family aminotransferase [Schleiferiaceae bacterium]